VNVNGSEMCSAVGFGISNIEHSSSPTSYSYVVFLLHNSAVLEVCVGL
jgi:hypothetical protein